MDVFAHTIWANAMARKMNEKRERENKEKVSLGWTSFWGVFPDLFAFTVPLSIVILQVIKGNPISVEFSEHGGPGSLASTLYHYSHSLVIWAVVFLIVWAYFKKPKLALLGWMLHILIDIPSHSMQFYPTPFLWPLSDYKFPYGIPWSNPWYMLVNYSALFILVLYFFPKSRKQN